MENVGRMRRVMIPLILLAALAVLTAAACATVFVYSGVYNIAADVPHTKPVLQLIEKFRDRSIDVRAAAIKPPADIDSETRLAQGGRLYANLCAGCHLAPGMSKTDLAKGLYPRPPALAYGTDLTPGQEFWIVKHGLKLTGMPSWGKTHDDHEIWDIVAFVRKMPDMDPAQYKSAVGEASPPKTANPG